MTTATTYQWRIGAATARWVQGDALTTTTTNVENMNVKHETGESK